MQVAQTAAMTTCTFVDMYGSHIQQQPRQKVRPPKNQVLWCIPAVLASCVPGTTPVAEVVMRHLRRCVVIEDSHIGLRAARAAGMRCIVTTSGYTADEDFSLADAVFDCIGDNFSMLDLTTPGKLASASS